jgi:putative addiction module killer protein
MPEVREYIDKDGRSRFAEWFDALEARAAARVVTAKIKLSAGQMGNLKPVGSGVAEYRIDYGPGYRVYLGQDGAQLIILLAGGDKSSQPRDIQEALRLWQEYKARKAKPAKPTATKSARKKR